MIQKSVVGKLWLTIIGLVSFVLIALYMLLGQFIYNYNYEEQTDKLQTLAERLADVFAESDHEYELMLSSYELVSAYNTRLIIIDTNYREIEPIQGEKLYFPELPIESLFSEGQMKLIFERTIVNRTLPQLINPANGQRTTLYDTEVVAVGVPIKKDGQVREALVLYQSLKMIENTTAGLHRMTLFALLIGILLTTFFAFFLSTKITNPLVQMKKAARLMMEGEFRTRVSIRSSDEIGELADTFNHMAAQLDETIHALSQEKDHLQSILRSMVDAVISVNSKGKVILTNPPAEQILHTWSEDQPGTIHKPRIPKPLLSIFDKVMTEEKEQTGDVTVHGRTWSFVMAPLYAREQLRGAVVVLRDVTEERRSDKLRKDFVANISHELRTPISMVQGYSEALLDEIAQTPEDRAELAHVIHEESLRMGRLVHDLLDLARMEAGHVEMHHSPVNMNVFIQRMRRKFAALCKENEIVFEEMLPERQFTLLIDEDRMEQVFTNLIDNAIRHTPEGGQITVRLEPVKQAIRIDISDSGTGIPEEDLPFIFERFYKADKARTRGSSGTGIGLSIVKNLIEAHGGSVSAQSKEGKGTTFSIILPVD
jgi:two-component system sensor histidine kinase ResE